MDPSTQALPSGLPLPVAAVAVVVLVVLVVPEDVVSSTGNPRFAEATSTAERITGVKGTVGTGAAVAGTGGAVVGKGTGAQAGGNGTVGKVRMGAAVTGGEVGLGVGIEVCTTGAAVTGGAVMGGAVTGAAASIAERTTVLVGRDVAAVIGSAVAETGAGVSTERRTMGLSG